MLIGCHHANVAAKFNYFNSSESVTLQILVNALACDRALMPCHELNLAAGFSSDKFR